MARIRERVVNVWVLPTPESSGGSIIGVPAVMAGIVGGVVAFAAAVAVAVVVGYPSTEYTNVPGHAAAGPMRAVLLDAHHQPGPGRG